MSNIRNQTVTTTEDELQVRDSTQHQRVFDPVNNQLLIEILSELKKMNTQLSLITDEEIES